MFIFTELHAHKKLASVLSGKQAGAHHLLKQNAPAVKSLRVRWRRRRDLNFIFPVLLLLFCLFPVYLCPNYKIYKLASHRLGTFPLSLSVFLKGKHKGKLSESSFTREAQFSITNKALAKFTSYVRLFNNLNYIFQLKRCSFPLRVPFIPW